MKNTPSLAKTLPSTQKGFASILIILLGLVVIGGGLYVYAQKNNLGIFSTETSKFSLFSNNDQEIWKIKEKNNSDNYEKVALDKDGSSYVFINNRVQKFDSNGNKICESFNKYISPDRNGGIVVGATGVYFSGLKFFSTNYQGGANYALVKIDKNCNEEWSLDDVSGATNITVDDKDNVYIGGYNIITKYDVNGIKIWEVNLDEQKIITISSLLFHKGKLYVFSRDMQVTVFDTNGQKVKMSNFITASDGFFDSKDNMYLNEDDGVITKYDKNWTKLWTVDVSEDSIQEDIGIMKFDNLGNIYFTFVLNGCFDCDLSLYKLDTQGNKTFVYENNKTIKDFAIDSENNLYITSASGFAKISQIKN